MSMGAKNILFRKFVLKLAAFFAVVFLLDAFIGHFLKKYYFTQESGYDYLTTYSIEKTTADMLVLGSSRAVNDFKTDIFENESGLSCFNAGRYGESVLYHHAVLKSILKRYTPKIIILSFDAGNFGKNQEAYDRLNVLLPYYKNHPEIRPILRLKSPNENLKLLSKIYPYNSLLIPIISGNTAYSKKKYPFRNGFIPLKKNFTGPLPVFDYTKEKELDTVKINTYKSFIEDCIRSNVRLYIVCPPYRINAIGTDSSIIKAKEIARNYKIDFFDYSRDSSFTNHPGLFADYRHLNEEGVDVFSKTIIKDIKTVARP